MALNYIWLAFFIVAFVVAVFKTVFYGDMQIWSSIMSASFSSAATAFEISLGLTGILSLWLGLMKIGEKGQGFAGEDITGKDPTQIVTQGVTLVPEGRRIFPDMTVLENLKIGAYLRKDDLSADIEWVYSLFPRLKERSWQAGGTLSGGEQQMLAVGRALMSRPKLLMMDEPSLGLAPLVVRDIFSIIQEINKQGVTILLIEQNANMALKIADVGYVLETGRITLTGSGKELLSNDAVRAAYLGA